MNRFNGPGKASTPPTFPPRFPSPAVVPVLTACASTTCAEQSGTSRRVLAADSTTKRRAIMRADSLLTQQVLDACLRSARNGGAPVKLEF